MRRCSHGHDQRGGGHNAAAAGDGPMTGAALRPRLSAGRWPRARAGPPPAHHLASFPGRSSRSTSWDDKSPPRSCCSSARRRSSVTSFLLSRHRRAEVTRRVPGEEAGRRRRRGGRRLLDLRGGARAERIAGDNHAGAPPSLIPRSRVVAG